MPREKDFSDQDVLATAAALFTRHGYAGTSLSMLTEATGVGKQSLYNAYGDKAALFCAALNHASGDFAPARCLQQESGTGRELIDRFFSAVLGEIDSADHPGCMLTHGLLELGDDDALAPELRARWEGASQGMVQAVKRGQADGSITNQLSAQEATDILMNLLGGLRIANKAHTSKPRLKAIVRNTLKLLDRSKDN